MKVYSTSVAKQAKTAFFIHGPTVWKSPNVGIVPATFRSESAALTTAPRDPTIEWAFPGLQEGAFATKDSFSWLSTIAANGYKVETIKYLFAFQLLKRQWRNNKDLRKWRTRAKRRILLISNFFKLYFSRRQFLFVSFFPSDSFFPSSALPASSAACTHFFTIPHAHTRTRARSPAHAHKYRISHL